MAATGLLYRLYERRLAADLRRRGFLPRHVGVVLDGNRRWARELGMDTSEGYRRGADQIDHLLAWSAELGIPVVTLWLLSTENLLQRHPAELAELLEIIEAKVVQLARDGAPDGYRIVPVGQLEALPERTRSTLLAAERASRGHSGGALHVAVGYGGRAEIADAVRRLLAEYGDKGLELGEAAGMVTPDEIARHLYTAGVPDPDLIIRTSGEIRLSGFLLWQSAHAEYYFADTYWPD
ncbi:MAG TPA: polyprenyl diphosphate synthase, partial [Actinomycetota bacterium]|nr:polyprenyl diphosphate synthase [Actinomycetota bacterium]